MLTKFRMYFSYNQFMVSDETIQFTGSAWTDAHYKQGFARRTSTVSFCTLLEFGHALIEVYLSPYIEKKSYERVIAVPFFSPSGRVVIEGPEDYPATHQLTLEPGHYRLIAAQQIISEDEEQISLFFQPLQELHESSEILVADDELDPPDNLLEDAEIAEV